MKIGIFYFSMKPGPERQIVWLDSKLRTWCYIRVQVVHATNLEHALDVAKPQEGESVMNTHELEPN